MVSPSSFLAKSQENRKFLAMGLQVQLAYTGTMKRPALLPWGFEFNIVSEVRGVNADDSPPRQHAFGQLGVQRLSPGCACLKFNSGGKSHEQERTTPGS